MKTVLRSRILGRTTVLTVAVLFVGFSSVQADDGRGIAQHELERVFQPFVQIDSTLTRTGEGTGLGLAISRDLARAMNGDLRGESTVGAGSTFTLLLPLA